jgi:cytochrome c-type biogenesis protein CcmH/NrfG
MAQKNRAPARKETTPKESKVRQGRLITYLIIFVCGFLSGIAFTVYKGSTPQSTSPTVAGGPTSAQDNETGQAILQLEAEVTAHPDNYDSWVQLGNLYFDNNQPEKAIGAYTKALALHPGNADLLTDLGVMYRRAKQPEKAIASFDQAIKADPAHLPARFNKGIVLMYDLGDSKGAIASWQEMLKIDPEAKTSNGESIGDFIKKIEADLANNK